MDPVNSVNSINSAIGFVIFLFLTAVILAGGEMARVGSKHSTRVVGSCSFLLSVVGFMLLFYYSFVNQ